jgi:hypothetical protein
MLLVVYGLSIIGYGMLEVSHGIMHKIKNKFHTHAHDSNHHFEDHHTVLYSPAASQPTDNDSISPFNSYFLFFEQDILILRNLVAGHSCVSETLERLTPFYSTPLVPPPLS